MIGAFLSFGALVAWGFCHLGFLSSGAFVLWGFCRLGLLSSGAFITGAFVVGASVATPNYMHVYVHKNLNYKHYWVRLLNSSELKICIDRDFVSVSYRYFINVSITTIASNTYYE